MFLGGNSHSDLSCNTQCSQNATLLVGAKFFNVCVINFFFFLKNESIRLFQTLDSELNNYQDT